jgi:ribosome-associated protein
MNIQELQALVIDALEDVKAQDIKLFDTAHLSSMFERMVVASGTSNRQTRALAVSVRDKVKAAGGIVIGLEGEDTGEWVLVDLGDMVVHIMQAPIRAYYRLEELWGEKSIPLDQVKQLAKSVSPAKSKSTAKATAKNTAKDSASEPETAAPKRSPRPRKLADSAREALEIPRKTRSRAAAPVSETTEVAKPPRTRKPAAAATAATAAPVARPRKPRAAAK